MVGCDAFFAFTGFSGFFGAGSAGGGFGFLASSDGMEAVFALAPASLADDFDFSFLTWPSDDFFAFVGLGASSGSFLSAFGASIGWPRSFASAFSHSSTSASSSRSPVVIKGTIIWNIT